MLNYQKDPEGTVQASVHFALERDPHAPASLFAQLWGLFEAVPRLGRRLFPCIRIFRAAGCTKGQEHLNVDSVTQGTSILISTKSASMCLHLYAYT